MPLTNVWTQDHNGEWVRTTASAMEKVFPYGAPASSHMFRCYNCFQYVTYSNTGDRVSHFKHNKWEENKDCEDRTFGTSGYTYGHGINDVPDPMRIRFDGTRAYLEIGFFPVPAVTVEKAMKEHMVIRIQGKMGSPDEYRVDWSRFEPHSTTWLHLPFSWALDYSVIITPSINDVKCWDIHRTPLFKHGTVFDAATGKRIPEKSDITVGREYYIVCDGLNSFYSRGGVKIGSRIKINDQWYLYKMSIPSYSNSAADFCFEALHLRLTTLPSEIQLLWPPAIEGDNLIDTNRKKLYMYVKGESDFETYPSYGTRSRNVFEVAENEKIIELTIVSMLQMVSTARYNQRLSFLYIRSLETSRVYYEPKLQILDDLDREVMDELNAAPLRGILRIISDVDTLVDVEDEDGFLYRVEVAAGQESRIQNIKCGMRLVVRHGLDILRKIKIGIGKKPRVEIIEESLPPWRGKLVPMPSRYAWILMKMDRSGELFRRTEKALREGMIPLDGLRLLSKLSGGIKHDG